MNKTLGFICIFTFHASICFANDSIPSAKPIQSSRIVIDSANPKIHQISVREFKGALSLTTDDGPFDKHLPWISALIVGFVTAAASWYIGRNQIKSLNSQIQSNAELTTKTLRANIVSANRQQWINELREVVSKFICESHAISVVYYRQAQTGEGIEVTDEWAEMAKQLAYYSAKIELMMNPSESETRQTLAIINQIRTDMQSLNFETIGNSIEALTSVMNTVFTNEWKKIKELN